MASVELGIIDPDLDAAVRSSLSARAPGCPPRSHRIFITDRVPDVNHEHSVWIVAPLPAPCHRALDRIAQGCVGAVLCEDELALLPVIIDTLAVGSIHLASNGVLRAAACQPPMTMRQRAILEHLVDGLSNVEIGARLGFSIATIKREVATIGDVLCASTRLDILNAADLLGYRMKLRRDDRFATCDTLEVNARAGTRGATRSSRDRQRGHR